MIRFTLILGLVVTLPSGCATQSLWKATNPDARVSLSEDEVSAAELRERGVPYRMDANGTYHVGKTSGERFGDHALRFMLTPAAVCLDVASVGLVVLAPLYLDELAAKSGGHTRASAGIEP